MANVTKRIAVAIAVLLASVVAVSNPVSATHSCEQAKAEMAWLTGPAVVRCVPPSDRAKYNFKSSVGGWMDGEINVVNTYDLVTSRGIIVHGLGHWCDWFILGGGVRWGSADYGWTDVEEYAKDFSWVQYGMYAPPEIPAPLTKPTAAQALSWMLTGVLPTFETPEIMRIYRASFLRDPDTGGMLFWSTRYGAEGQSLYDIANFFSTSDEFVQRYGRLSNRQFVNRVYLNVLKRPADPAGLAWWNNQLDSGKSRGWVLVGFSESAEFRASNPPRSVVD